MFDCQCNADHPQKRIVLTGGPGAGKTAVLELARYHLCRHVQVLPEAAGIVFGGGFPRTRLPVERAAAQRAIYHVQRELEAIAESRTASPIVLCDRGTVDGAAYWVGPGSFWDSIGSERDAELCRYDAVMHLRTPPPADYDHENPLRTENAAEAGQIDSLIVEVWEGHPRRRFISSTRDFLDKAEAALQCLQLEIPECCRPRSRAVR